MPAFGYLFLLVGGMLIRQVVVGRAVETPGDIRDLSLAFLQGDMTSVGEVFSRRGENTSVVRNEVAVLDDGTPVPGGDAASPTAHTLFEKVFALGSAASGYRLGATGPTYYDCSGLIWRAMKDTGIYTGPRFTTTTFPAIAVAKKWTKVDTPSEGDIVLWAGHHMGIAADNAGMYSARSTSKGIGPSLIQGDAGFFGYQPTYYRIG
jgi:hypothetical protein